MPNLPPAVLGVLVSAATVFAIGVLFSLARRRLGYDPVERVASAVDRVLPSMPAAAAVSA